MNRDLTFAKYRTIDLLLLCVVTSISETVICRAAISWFPGQPYTVSVVLAMTVLTAMRWNGLAAIVAVGRAIIRKVGVFLMDEPLSNLDAKQRVTMRSEITQIHRETGATTIYVTHDQTEAMTMADRIVVMRDGYMQQIGTPKELYFHPVNRFVAGFIGEPSMNFVETTVMSGTATVGGCTLDLSHVLPAEKLASYEGKKLTFSFRPEAIRLGETEDAYTLRAKVELTELLGDSTNVYITLPDAHAILKIDPHDTPALDSEIAFSIPYGSVYLFDGETETVI